MSYAIGGGGLGQLSLSGDAVLTTDYASNEIAKGYGFALEDVFSISTGATAYVLIDYTTYTDLSGGRSGTVYILAPRFSSTAGPVVVTVYRGTDYSGGSAMLYSSRNTNAAIDPQISITLGATGSSLGTPVLKYLVGTQAQGVSRAGGTQVGIVPFIRDNSDKTLLAFNNQSGSDIQMGYGQVFYEL